MRWKRIMMFLFTAAFLCSVTGCSRVDKEPEETVLSEQVTNQATAENKVKKSQNQDTYPEILFVYVHNEEGKNGKGNYIDSTGNIIEFDFSEEETFLKYDELYDALCKNKKEVKDTIKMSTGKSYYKKLCKIKGNNDENITVTESNLDVVLGYDTWIGYRFNEAKQIEAVVLAGEGDRIKVNKQEAAGKIADWLKDVLNK